MSAKLNRHAFITLLGVVATWPLAASGQQREHMRRVVFLHALDENDPEVQVRIAVFGQGLAALGRTPSRNGEMLNKRVHKLSADKPRSVRIG